MICKGTTHNNGARLASYLTRGKAGERAELWQLRGFEATNIKDAFRDVHIMADGTKCEQPFFHVQVRNREGETLTRQQWEHAADRIERMLGLAGQPRAIAFHIDEKSGGEHMHVAWSRIDEESLTARPLPFFKDRLKKLSRELELHFGLEPVTNKRESEIKYAPTRAQEEQARRVGLDIHELRNTIRACYDHSDCGASFRAALEQEGMVLAQGERRDFVVIDQGGGIHALGKRILDVTAARIRERLSDLSREELPTIAMARLFVSDLQVSRQQRQDAPAVVWDRDRADRLWQDAVIKAAIAKEQAERNFVEPCERENWKCDGRNIDGGKGARADHIKPDQDRTASPTHNLRPHHLKGAAAQVWTAWRACNLNGEKSKTPVEANCFSASRNEDFAAALDKRGITFAAVTRQEAERSQQKADFARAVGRYAQRYEEGEIVLIVEPRPEYRRNGQIVQAGRIQKLDQALAESFVNHLGIRNQLQGVEGTLILSDLRAQHRSAEIAERRMARATDNPELSHNTSGTLVRSVRAGNSTLRTASKVLDSLANAFESILAPTLTPQQKLDAEIARSQRNAQTEHAIDFSRFTAELSLRSRQLQEELEAEARRQRERTGRER